MDFDFNWDVQPFDGVYVYIAMSEMIFRSGHSITIACIS